MLPHQIYSIKSKLDLTSLRRKLINIVVDTTYEEVDDNIIGAMRVQYSGTRDLGRNLVTMSVETYQILQNKIDVIPYQPFNKPFNKKRAIKIRVPKFLDAKEATLQLEKKFAVIATFGIMEPPILTVSPDRKKIIVTAPTGTDESFTAGVVMIHCTRWLRGSKTAGKCVVLKKCPPRHKRRDLSVNSFSIT